VHAFPSLQELPLDLAGLEQAPVAMSHVPAVWHWSDAAQVTALEPEQVPAWQVSVWVHAFPSLHAEPSVLLGLLHKPVAGAHVPATWHWSDAAQVTGDAPVQVPD
jgi:hypothetical protein